MIDLKKKTATVDDLLVLAAAFDWSLCRADVSAAVSAVRRGDVVAVGLIDRRLAALVIGGKRETKQCTAPKDWLEGDLGWTFDIPKTSTPARIRYDMAEAILFLARAKEFPVTYRDHGGELVRYDEGNTVKEQLAELARIRKERQDIIDAARKAKGLETSAEKKARLAKTKAEKAAARKAKRDAAKAKRDAERRAKVAEKTLVKAQKRYARRMKFLRNQARSTATKIQRVKARIRRGNLQAQAAKILRVELSNLFELHRGIAMLMVDEHRKFSDEAKRFASQGEMAIGKRTIRFTPIPEAEFRKRLDEMELEARREVLTSAELKKAAAAKRRAQREQEKTAKEAAKKQAAKTKSEKAKEAKRKAALRKKMDAAAAKEKRAYAAGMKWAGKPISQITKAANKYKTNEERKVFMAGAQRTAA